MNNVRHALGALLTLILLSPAPGLSQQQSTPGAIQIGDATAQNPDGFTGFSQQQPNPAATSGGFFINALNSANPLSEESGPLRWGWVSIRSASFLQYYSQIHLSDSTLQSQNGDLNSSQLSTALVVDHTFRSSQLSLQYSPSLFIANGHVYPNALNQSGGLDTNFILTPRWGLQLSDRVSYYGSQRYFSETSLDVNYLSGSSVQKNFLDGPGSVLNNSAVATFSYLWSPRTTITFAPTFGYQYGTGAVFSGNNISALYEGGRFSLTHQLSPSQSIGINYSAQYGTYTNSSTQAGPQSNSLLQDAKLGFRQQLRASWWLGVGLGVSRDSGPSGSNLLGVSASISKAFHRAEFALTYNRGHQFNGFITNAASNRIDASQKIYWGQRFFTTTSVAYFKNESSFPQSQSASYATEEMCYGLTRRLSLTGSISYIKQVGDGVFVASGNRRFATFGITWNAPVPTRY